jgi:Lon-like protease
MSDDPAGSPAGGPVRGDPADKGGAEEGRGRRRVLRALGKSILVSLGAVLIAAAFIHVPYVIISPGAATPLDHRVVEVQGAQTYPHNGDLLYLTVRVSDTDPNLYRWLFAQLDGDVSVTKKDAVIGCASYAATARLNDLLMQESQDAAKTVALRRLGYSPSVAERRVLVYDVSCDGPSHDVLQPGDLIKAIDGKPVSTQKEVRTLVRAHRPGERIPVTIGRGGRTLDVTARLGREGDHAILGVLTELLERSTFPVDVKIDTRRVSGPSAGLAFTLAIIDDLTPGDLTGGRRVAVTGSISRDGTVGIVGGIEQKAITARDNGAALMLVPAGEARDARAEVGGDLRVVAVRNVDDALRALRRAGGALLPPPATTPSGR